MGEVKVALVGEGLAKEEVTIAEVLSSAGYNTAHIGKWHMGDIEEAFPHNQGFDFAAFPVHQQVQLALMTADADYSTQLSGWYKGGLTDEFAIDQRFRPFGLVTALEGNKGQAAHEVEMKPGEEWTQKKYNEMHERYQRQTLEQLRSFSASDEPRLCADCVRCRGRRDGRWRRNDEQGPDGRNGAEGSGGWKTDQRELLEPL